MQIELPKSSLSLALGLMLASPSLLGCTKLDEPGVCGASGTDGGDGLDTAQLQLTDVMQVHDKWSCSLSAALACMHGVELGDQVRVQNNQNGQLALYTVALIDDDDPGLTIGVTQNGLDRLDGASQDVLVNRIVPAQMTPAAAEAAGDIVESTVLGGHDQELLVLAPHGGDIEFGSDMIGEQLTDIWPGDVSSWICRGWHEFGAFLHLHISSDVVSERSFPGLDSFGPRRYQRVVSFHGHGGPDSQCGFTDDVVVGGRAPAQLRELIRDTLTAEFMVRGKAFEIPKYTVVLAPPDEDCSGTASNNVVNRLSVCGGVQLELSSELRHDEVAWQAVAAAVERALLSWSGCPMV